MKKNLLVPAVGFLLVVSGIVVLLAAPYIRDAQAATQAQPPLPSDPSAYATVEKQPGLQQGKPRSLEIADLSLAVEVIDGTFQQSTGQWTLTLNKAQHAINSVQANNKAGMTFIYAHNRRGLFDQLPKIKNGAEAKVKTENGLTFTYRMMSRRTTKPSDASIFSYTGKPILVLQTCTGIFFQNRELYTFEFVEAQ